jgi:hypothetical protein
VFLGLENIPDVPLKGPLLFVSNHSIMALGERRETGRRGDEREGDERVGSEGRRGREKRQKGGKGVGGIHESESGGVRGETGDEVRNEKQ